MNRSTSVYFNALAFISWQEPENFNFPNDEIKHWLLEQGSLSRRLASCCQQLSVDVVQQEMVKTSDYLQSCESSLFISSVSLLRKVILQGDCTPWVVGQTLIPQTTLSNQFYDLTHQGNVPLGLTVFSAQHVYRDGLQVGRLSIGDELLFARRSRLWMNHKPMLVTEIFLPNAPFYEKETAS